VAPISIAKTAGGQSSQILTRSGVRRANASDDRPRNAARQLVRLSFARAKKLAESRGMPCLFLNTERGFGGKPSKKSGFRRHLAGSLMAPPVDERLIPFAEKHVDLALLEQPQKVGRSGCDPADVPVRIEPDMRSHQRQQLVRRHPVAAKRALRAILKAADLCATDRDRAARRILAGGFADRYEYALQTLSENSYDKWREYDPEDTIRFYALRLRDVGLIKSTPQQIIADGTDWRFLDELKRELKVIQNSHAGPTASRAAG
jgi:hypothetical protein